MPRGYSIIGGPLDGKKTKPVDIPFTQRGAIYIEDTEGILHRYRYDFMRGILLYNPSPNNRQARRLEEREKSKLTMSKPSTDTEPAVDKA